MKLWIMGAAALALSGCAATTAGGERIGGIEWQATDLNGAPLVSGTRLTLRLDDGRASGSTGCNYWFGSYRLGSREAISFSQIGSTRRACPEPPRGEQEQRYLNILANASGYNFYRDGTLVIIAADGRAIRFTR